MVVFWSFYLCRFARVCHARCVPFRRSSEVASLWNCAGHTRMRNQIIVSSCRHRHCFSKMWFSPRESWPPFIQRKARNHPFWDLVTIHLNMLVSVLVTTLLVCHLYRTEFLLMKKLCLHSHRKKTVVLRSTLVWTLTVTCSLVTPRSVLLLVKKQIWIHQLCLLLVRLLTYVLRSMKSLFVIRLQLNRRHLSLTSRVSYLSVERLQSRTLWLLTISLLVVHLNRRRTLTLLRELHLQPLRQTRVTGNCLKTSLVVNILVGIGLVLNGSSGV